MGETSVLDVAARFFAAIEAGDIDTVCETYSPDVVVWHNHDGTEQTREENLRTLSWLAGHVGGLRYDDVRRSATAGGFVQQHVVRGRNALGEEFAIPACLVVTLVDGRITRLDEYLDSRHADVVTARPPKGSP
jgi:ketosteroid isomerase-like protein